VNAALDAFDAIERIRVPRDLTVDHQQGRAVFVVDTPGGGASVHVVDLENGASGTHDDDAYTYAHLRAVGDGTIVAARGLVDGELEVVVRLDPVTGAVLVEVPMTGAIEDIAELPDGRWLVRIAEPGSERDGMHLGTIVAPIAGPMVDPAERWWRRLFEVDVHTGSVVAVPTPGWTIWEAVGDADSIVAVASEEPSPAGYYRPALIRIDRDSGDVAAVYRTERQLARPRLLADGRTCLVVEGRSIVSGRIRRIDLHTGSSALVCRASAATGADVPIEDVTDIAFDGAGRWWLAGWHDRGSFVEVCSPDGTPVVRVDLDGTLIGRVAQPSVHPIGDGDAVVVLDRAAAPVEVVRLFVADGRTEVLSGLNGHTVDELGPLHCVDRRWLAPDGTEIRGDLLLPAALEPAARSGPTAPPPLVVLIHGGPTWLWSRQFAPAESIALARALVAGGVAVLLPNPRGSSGRGLDYADAIAGAIGDADVHDVVAGVDELVRDGLVDHARVAVIGTSYGGYLAAWLAATTDRFRCAVAMSAVADWCSFATTSAIGGGFERVYFPGVDITTPAGREALASRSPAHHADPITTPLLVLHGAADRITPVGQAHQLAHAWRRARAPADVVIYSDEGHEPVAPRARRDAARRVVGFLHRHGIMT
jgi:dipeptidyl aminopeptidase/acylaminoacyl peptidase